MDRKWLWYMLVVALLLFISLEAATADEYGKGGNNGKGNGRGNGDDHDNGQENGDDNDNSNGKGKGDQPTLSPPPPSQTPPNDEQTPPSQTPPTDDQTPPQYALPTFPSPFDFEAPPREAPPTDDQTPPQYTPPTFPPYPSDDQTPPTYTSPPSLFPGPQTPPSPNYKYQPPSGTPRNGVQETIDYYMLSPIERTGQERASCQLDEGLCYLSTLTCPAECPHRRPLNNNMKGCYIDCSGKCEATCKWRKPNCNNYGSLCYDPRFVGGDGNMFYFHGYKGSDFAIVTDEDLQINAHFIGTRPAGRTRDFTWVQALSIMFDTHTLIIAATKVSKWDDKVEALIVKWDGEIINIPRDGEAEWRINTENNRVVVVERTDDLNTVRATVSGLVQVDTKVVPIGKHENKVHHYQLPSDDAFAHLEIEFKFFKLSPAVEGVLGRTYQPGFESPVKMGVAMPLMGGEEKYQTPSLSSPLCKACKFHRPSSTSNIAVVTAI